MPTFDSDSRAMPSNNLQYDHITSTGQLEDFCERLSTAELIAFDTEFVAEDTYLPELCLVQVAAGEHLAVIDAMAIRDLAPFWELLVKPNHITVVHAGREEFRFCRRATEKRPANLFDVQIAAALIGLEYPAAYGTLISRLLGKTLPKGETRTNWRRRPLSDLQIQYALQDVVDLQLLSSHLHDRLQRLDRLSWLQDEMNAWQTSVETMETTDRWRRVSGLSGLSSRSLAIVRELWQWRDQEAERRNQPAKRILRDDLIVELAKRRSADVKRIRAVRGLERHRLQKHLGTLAECIQAALDLPEKKCPQPARRNNQAQLTLIGQFLSTALSSICRSARVAPSIVGAAQDVRDLIAYQLGLNGDRGEPPSLATGWRAEVVGNVIDDLLAGRTAIRIKDPASEHPLTFEQTPPADAE